MMKHSLLALPLAMVASFAWTQPAIEVFKSPTCGCCGNWIKHIEDQGFTVSAEDTEAMHRIKAAAGVPDQLASCHTGRAGKYFIEGHVPAADIKRLLEQQPDARGLTVPGMPVGSPGMEMGNRKDAFQVLLVNEDGSTTVFSEYPGQ